MADTINNCYINIGKVIKERKPIIFSLLGEQSMYSVILNRCTNEAVRKYISKFEIMIFTCGVFIDVEKTFHTVSDEILLSKKNNDGIRENAL